MNMQVSSLHLIFVAAALALALTLTPVVRALARRWGAVAKPKTDRWHKKPTAMLGGVAIWFSVTLVMAVYLLFVPHETPYGWVVVGASSFLFFVGLADDLFHAKP
ncbi:MAG: hypothetical protein ICV68_08810, partial [Pyrinomonadaceae bacterium]|nr:hypothetical protein [Pyrinomonadaceae bacterium]